MNFDANYDTLRDEYKKYLVYENNSGSNDILIFTDTPEGLGYLTGSDIICVFDDKTNSLLAFVERVRKRDMSLFGRIHLAFYNHTIMHDAPLGFECYIQKRGEFYEYQFYRRWWYDLSVQFGSIDIGRYVSNQSTSGKDKSSP